MPMHMIAHAQSVDPAGAYTAITGAAGEIVCRTVANDIFVPTLNQVIMVAAGVESAVESFARLTAPSLLRRMRYEINPLNMAAAAAVEPGSPPAVVDLRRTPLKLVKDEGLRLEINSNPAAAQWQWGVYILADAPPAPVQGDVFTVLATGATALVAGTWVNVPLTFPDQLPRGRYAVVGFRPRSAGMIASRLVFLGAAGGWRPGALGLDVESDLQHEMFRNGGLGVYGEFEDTDMFSVDCLAISADAAEDFLFDLLQLRDGPA